MLDESHLELVEDVLTVTNFNNKDWYELGQELEVHDNDEPKRIVYPEDSSNLRNCLRRWLSLGKGPTTTTIYRLRILDDKPLPTFYDLAVAIDNIGYGEAADYIIKTRKLIMLNFSVTSTYIYILK